MSAFHVPSVPRGLLLPGLDTHEARNEEQADPTPAGSHVSARSSTGSSTSSTAV